MLFLGEEAKYSAGVDKNDVICVPEVASINF